MADGDVLNMRAAPYAGSARLGSIPPGTNGVRNLGCEGGLDFAAWQDATQAERDAAARSRWCKVEHGGVEGWVAARFLAEGRAPAAAPAGTTPAERGAAWPVVALDGEPPLGATEIGFGPDGGVFGATDCNRFTGTGRLEGTRIVIDGPLATTRMACPGPLDAQEGQVFTILANPMAIGFDPFLNRLELANAAGTLTVDVQSTASDETAAPSHSFQTSEGAGADYVSVFGLEGHLNIRAEASTGSDTLARVLPGTVLRNSGCSEGDARRWCEVETLDGTQTRGWAAAEYLEPAGSALRAGQGIFEAIGHVPCAQAQGQPMGRCEFGVARDGGGSATVVVIRPDTTRRALFFQNGAFVSADTSEADGYPETDASREGDLTRVRVGGERYEVPDAVLYGG